MVQRIDDLDGDGRIELFEGLGHGLGGANVPVSDGGGENDKIW